MKIFKIIKSVTLFSSLLLSPFALAGGIETPPPCPAPAFSNWYLLIGSGYGWSNKANMAIDYTLRNGDRWLISHEGYNTTLNNSSFITAGFGQRIFPTILSELSVSYFGGFRYRRFLTSNDPIDPFKTYQRYFNLSNVNLMYRMAWNNPCFAYSMGPVSLSPFVGGGIGLALNTVNNFYSIDPNGVRTSTGQDKPSIFSLAAQGDVGFSAQLSPRTALDVGYRFYYGGRFQGPTRILTSSAGVVTVTPWKGQLSANLLFVDLRFSV